MRVPFKSQTFTNQLLKLNSLLSGNWQHTQMVVWVFLLKITFYNLTGVFYLKFSLYKYMKCSSNATESREMWICELKNILLAKIKWSISPIVDRNVQKRLFYYLPGRKASFLRSNPATTIKIKNKFYGPANTPLGIYLNQIKEYT